MIHRAELHGKIIQTTAWELKRGDKRFKLILLQQNTAGKKKSAMSAIRLYLKSVSMGFPGGSVSGKESTCQCRGHGFNPWSKEIPQATEQLSLRATTTEPICCNFRRPRTTMEQPSRCEVQCTTEREQPLPARPEKAHASPKTQHSQKINNKIN